MVGLFFFCLFLCPSPNRLILKSLSLPRAYSILLGWPTFRVLRIILQPAYKRKRGEQVSILGAASANERLSQNWGAPFEGRCQLTLPKLHLLWSCFGSLVFPSVLPPGRSGKLGPSPAEISTVFSPHRLGVPSAKSFSLSCARWCVLWNTLGEIPPGFANCWRFWGVVFFIFFGLVEFQEKKKQQQPQTWQLIGGVKKREKSLFF